MMPLVYIALGLYLGLFLAGKRWLTFEVAAKPWVWLIGFIRSKFGNRTRVYTSQERTQDDVREKAGPMDSDKR